MRMQLFFIQHQVTRLSFFCFIKFREDQSQTLIIGKIVIDPIAKDKKTVFYTQDQNKMQAHPDDPGNESSEMELWFWKVCNGKIASYCGQSSFIAIFKLGKFPVISLKFF